MDPKGGYSIDIGPGTESFKKWQDMREKTIFPEYREKLRKHLYVELEGLCPSLGYKQRIDFDIAQDVFPEEYAMITAIKNRLHNKLNPMERQYPETVEPRFTSTTDRGIPRP